jgi:hypothetical protein
MSRPISAARLAWRPPFGDDPIAVGDVIRTGEGLHPHYEVIATSGESAWVRDVQYQTDHVVPIDRCTRI